MKLNTRHLALFAAVAALVTTGMAVAGPGKRKGPKQVVTNGIVQAAAVDSETGAATFTVHQANRKDVACALTAETQFLRADGSAGSASDVGDGAKVQVKGVKDETGVVQAKRVLIKKLGAPAPEPEPEPEPEPAPEPTP